MSTYLVCYKKRNNPRIDIRVCLRKCSLRDDCKEFQSHQKAVVRGEAQSLSMAEPDRLAAA